jgi:hypothetical protein
MDVPKPRRWFRFSLRTMFVLVTVFCVWLGCSLNWIRQRREEIKSGRAFDSSQMQMCFQRSAETPTWRAPALLRFFGERGYFSLGTQDFQTNEECLAEAVRVRRLFPEAIIYYSVVYPE